MAFCKKCGAEIEGESKYCSVCGTYQESEVNDQIFNKASGKLNVGSLIWSIINVLMCCMPLGIASLVMTILAQNASDAEDEAKKLKTAKTFNLIATIGGAVIIIVYIIIVVVAGLAVASNEIAYDTAALPFR